jgi:DNA repair protein RecO (recombination protein O)
VLRDAGRHGASRCRPAARSARTAGRPGRRTPAPATLGLMSAPDRWRLAGRRRAEPPVRRECSGLVACPPASGTMERGLRSLPLVRPTGEPLIAAPADPARLGCHPRPFMPRDALPGTWRW